jgi:hypothetical protein
MRIILDIAPVFHKHIPDKNKHLASDTWDLAERTTGAELLKMLHLISIPAVLVLNDRQCDKAVVLKEGDHLKVYPLAGGG